MTSNVDSGVDVGIPFGSWEATVDFVGGGVAATKVAVSSGVASSPLHATTESISTANARMPNLAMLFAICWRASTILLMYFILMVQDSSKS